MPSRCRRHHRPARPAGAHRPRWPRRRVGRRRGGVVRRPGAATTTRADASRSWNTRPTSRWPSAALQPDRRRGARAAGRARGWACTIGSAGSSSARPASSSSRRRRTARDAFAACRYTIERVKQIVPIWKHEHFEGGDVWLEGATADPGRRGGARRRRTGSHARDGPAVCAAARSRGRRRAGPRRAGSGDGRTRSGGRWSTRCRRCGDYERTMSVAVNADYSRMIGGGAATATRSRSCRRCPADKSSTYGRRCQTRLECPTHHVRQAVHGRIALRRADDAARHERGAVGPGRVPGRPPRRCPTGAARPEVPRVQDRRTGHRRHRRAGEGAPTPRCARWPKRS